MDCKRDFHYGKLEQKASEYLGGYSLDANEVVDVPRSQGPGGDVAGPEAALEADVEFFALLGIRRVKSTDKFFQGTLKAIISAM